MAKKPKKEEAPPEAGEGGEGAEAKPAGRRKLFIIAGAGVLALALVGGGTAWFLGLFGSRERPPAEAAHPAPPPPPRAAFMDVPDITVNLAGTQSRPQYLRLKVALEIADPATAQQITPLMPRILDSFQTFLREMRTADLEGTAAVHRVREEMTRRVNLVVQPARVEAVLFREFLVQ